MATSFFEHQDVARRNTKILVLLYALAVAAVIVAVDIVLAVTWLATSSHDATSAYLNSGSLLRAVPAKVYLWGRLARLLTIVCPPCAAAAAVVAISASGW